MYVSSYYVCVYVCVTFHTRPSTVPILLCMCPHTTVCVLILRGLSNKIDRSRFQYFGRSRFRCFLMLFSFLSWSSFLLLLNNRRSSYMLIKTRLIQKVLFDLFNTRIPIRTNSVTRLILGPRCVTSTVWLTTSEWSLRTTLTRELTTSTRLVSHMLHRQGQNCTRQSCVRQSCDRQRCVRQNCPLCCCDLLPLE